MERYCPACGVLLTEFSLVECSWCGKRRIIDPRQHVTPNKQHKTLRVQQEKQKNESGD